MLALAYRAVLKDELCCEYSAHILYDAVLTDRLPASPARQTSWTKQLTRSLYSTWNVAFGGTYASLAILHKQFCERLYTFFSTTPQRLSSCSKRKRFARSDRSRRMVDQCFVVIITRCESELHLENGG